MRILCLGDSLTSGWYSQGEEFEPYSKHVQTARKGDTVLQMGYPGADAPALKRVLETSTEYISCDVVVVLIGTNDIIRQCRKGDEESSVRVFSNIHQLYRILLDKHIKIIPVTVPPLVGEDPTDGLTIARNFVNSAIRTFAKDQELQLVEFHDAIREVDSSTHFDDECHMSPLGYQLLAKLVIEKLSKI